MEPQSKGLYHGMAVRDNRNMNRIIATLTAALRREAFHLGRDYTVVDTVTSQFRYKSQIHIC